MKARSFYAVVLLGLFLTATAQGQAPMISYQGKLTDNAGEPLNATVSIQFSIYSQSSGGTALWTETQSSVSVSSGIFNVLLGSVTPIPNTVFNGSDRWLGLKVGSDAEMSPRQQIVSVGYALMAAKANEADNANAADYTSDADMVDGQHASDFAGATHNHDADYVNEAQANSITSSMIVDGTILQDDLSFGVPDGYSLDAADGNPSDALYLDNNGNVGIGTTSPATKLEVVGYSNAQLGGFLYGVYGYCTETAVCGENSGGNVGALGTSTYGVFGNTSSGWAGYFNGKTYMGGNVGIGTTSPDRDLEISGVLRVAREANNSHGADFSYVVDEFITGHDGLIINSNTGGGWSDIHLRTRGSTKLFVESGGYVGIGTTSPGYKLDVAGDAHASGFPTSSDVRFKTNVTQLTNVLEKLEKIRGVSFEWNQMYESLGRSTGHKEIGVIAQEVEEVFPELVTTWGEDKYRAVDYGRLTGVLIEAIKELRAKNTSLQHRIELLEKVINQE